MNRSIRALAIASALLAAAGFAVAAEEGSAPASAASAVKHGAKKTGHAIAHGASEAATGTAHVASEAATGVKKEAHKIHKSASAAAQ